MWVVYVQIACYYTLVVAACECQVVVRVTLVVKLAYHAFNVYVGLLSLV